MQNRCYIILVAYFLFALSTSSSAHQHPIDSMNRMLDLTHKENQKVDILNEMSRYYVQRQLDSVEYYAKKALKISKKINYTEGEIKALNIKAQGAFQHGLVKNGFFYLNQAKELALSVRSNKGQADNLLVHSTFLRTKGLYDESLEKSKEALQLYYALHDADGLRNTYNSIGNVYSDLRNYSPALDAYKKALTKSQELKNNAYISSAYNNLANIQGYQQNHFEALQNYQNAINFARRSNNEVMEAISYSNIGILYEELEDYEAAEENFTILLKLAEQLGNQNYLFASYDNFGNIYRKQKKYEQAEEYYAKALRIADSLNMPPYLALCYENIGKVKHYKGDYTGAIASHQRAIDIFTKTKQEQELAIAQIGLAESNKSLGNKKEALNYAFTAYNWAKTKGVDEPSILRDATEVISKLYEELGNYKEAYIYHKRYKEVSDAMVNNDVIREFDQQKSKEEYAQKQEQGRIDAQEEKDNQNQLIGIVGGFLILLLLIGALSYWRLQSKTKVIEEKNRELNIKGKNLEELNATKDKLFAIIGHDLRGPIGGLESVLTMLLSNELTDEEFLEMASDLKQNTTNVHQMLDNLLQWSTTQINEGNTTIPTIINLQEQTNNIINFLNELAKEKELNIKNTINEQLLVTADLDHTDLILRNLISNAIKFTEKGGFVQIGSNLDRDIATFFVKDTGIGMTSIQLQQLFTDSNTTPRWGTAGEKGVGLGLSLCKEMVKKNGGKIWAESIPNKGSVFYFTLPKATPPQLSELKSPHFSSL